MHKGLRIRIALAAISCALAAQAAGTFDNGVANAHDGGPAHAADHSDHSAPSPGSHTLAPQLQAHSANGPSNANNANAVTPKVWLPQVSMSVSAGLCGESNTSWHSQVINDCQIGHEHGDEPPKWIYDSGHKPSFEHPANTPNENLRKHTSFKGFSLRDDGIHVYAILHVDTNPSGHNSRFHSYQVWAKDQAENVSYWRGWMDFGHEDLTGPQISRAGCDADIRPVMFVFTPECWSNPSRFETWYSLAGGSGTWSWDFGYTGKANYYFGGDPANPSTWKPTGDLNDRRRIELSWYADRSSLRGKFYANQWGDVVEGLDDPSCGTNRSIGGKTYQVLCLEQYVAPSMTTFAFPDNSIERDYDTTGVKLPN